MATKKKPGRPKSKNPVRNVSAYLTDTDKKKVEKRYGSVTKALKIEVLPKCG